METLDNRELRGVTPRLVWAALVFVIVAVSSVWAFWFKVNGDIKAIASDVKTVQATVTDYQTEMASVKADVRNVQQSQHQQEMDLRLLRNQVYPAAPYLNNHETIFYQSKNNARRAYLPGGPVADSNRQPRHRYWLARTGWGVDWDHRNRP